MRHLDANACIEILRGRNLGVIERYQASDPTQIAVSSIVAAELMVGAMKSVRPTAIEDVEAFLSGHDLVAFGEAEMREYARVRSALEKAGMRIGANDLIVAATALAHRAILVTHNLGEFSRVPGLMIEDWHL